MTLSLRNISSTSLYSFILFARKGKSIQEIAQIRGQTTGSIVRHLLPFIATGIAERFISSRHIVPAETRGRVNSYLADNPDCSALTDIYKALNKDVSYDNIRLSIALNMREEGFSGRSKYIWQYNKLLSELVKK